MIVMALGAPYRLGAWTELALAAPVQLLAGARFYRGAWQSLRRRPPTWTCWSPWEPALPSATAPPSWLGWTAGHLYFEASAVIITLVLAGKWLEPGPVAGRAGRCGN